MRIGPLTLHQPVPLATGGLHKPALSARGPGVGRAGVGDDRIWSMHARCWRNATRRFKLIETRPRTSLWRSSYLAPCPRRCGTRRVAWNPRVGVHRHQHGLPGRKVVRVGGGSAMMTELEDRRACPGHGGRCQDPGHGEDAVGLGRREHHRAGLGARVGGRRRNGHFHSWPHAGARVQRHGQPGRHSRRRRRRSSDPGYRQRRCHHPGGREST